MQDAGKLPDYIVDMFEAQSKKAENPTKFKRDIVNNLLVENKDGSFSLDVKNNIFKEAETNFEEKKASTGMHGLQKNTFIASRFSGNVDLFELATAAGEIDVVESDGKMFYTVKEISSSTTRGEHHSWKY